MDKYQERELVEKELKEKGEVCPSSYNEECEFANMLCPYYDEKGAFIKCNTYKKYVERSI